MPQTSSPQFQLAQQTQVFRSAEGIYSDVNFYSKAPAGAALVAENLTLISPGTWSRRRGFDRFGASVAAKKLLRWGGRVIASNPPDLYYDATGNGLWTAWPGAWHPPTQGIAVRGAEFGADYYLATARGIYSTPEITETPIRAGLPAGLDLTLQGWGGAGGWKMPGTQVAYRQLWGRFTTTAQLVLGAPSMRATITSQWRTSLNWTAAGTTVTVTHPSHGYSTGDFVAAQNLSNPAAAPASAITVINSNSYSYTAVGTPPASGTGDFGRVESVLIRMVVPDDLRPGDFYEVYRSVMSASASVDPGDELFRVVRTIIPDYAAQAIEVSVSGSGTTVTVTAPKHGLMTGDWIEILSASNPGFETGLHIVTSVIDADHFTYTVTSAPSSGSIVFREKTLSCLDSLPEELLSDPLYTNPNLEGIERANTRPPNSADLANWRGRMWYANVFWEHYLDLQLLTTSGLSSGSSITLHIGSTQETYIADSTENPRSKHFYLDTSSSTLAERIRNTALSLVRVINIASANFYAAYTSGIDEAPGYISIEARGYDTGQFSLTASSATVGACFSPEIPTSGEDLCSDNDTLPNAILYSKPGMAHAVPYTQIFDEIGDATQPILRIIPTRDALYVIKQDGIYRITGDSELSFTIRALDLTLQPRAPNSWCSLDDAVWGLSTKGVVRISDSGILIISEPVREQISKILLWNSDTVPVAGWASEAQGLYFLSAPTYATATAPGRLWVFSSRRFAGPTCWTIDAWDGIYVPAYDGLVIARCVEPYVYKERRTLTDLDFVDESIECTVDAISDISHPVLGATQEVTVTFPASTTDPTTRPIEAGDLLWRNPSSLQPELVYSAQQVEGSTRQWRLVLRKPIAGLSTGQAFLLKAIPVSLQLIPFAGDIASAVKHFHRFHAYFGTAQPIRIKLSFQSNGGIGTPSTVDLFFSTPPRIVDIPVPLEQASGNELLVTIENRDGGTPFQLYEVAVDYMQGAMSSNLLPR